MEVLDLFPTPLGVTNLGRDLTPDEDKFLMSQEYAQGSINSKNNYVLEDPVMSRLKMFIHKNAQDFADRVYKPAYPIKLQITQSWTNRLIKTEAHPPHSHSNAFISGVFYVRAIKEIDRINFLNISHRPLIPKIRENNQYNSMNIEMAAHKGILLLFPSSLFHNVMPLEHKGPRVSLSFNLFPVNGLGSVEDLNYIDFSNLKDA
jgi:uncharacterized protein (TIGR02466 family)